jgi:uncharacterized protein YbjT (DUF2867 family)
LATTKVDLATVADLLLQSFAETNQHTMKIIITGSLGHISKPLTEELVQKGHAVTVISSKDDKQPTIKALGATAAIGTLEDTEFLADTFTGADAVYTMVPPNYYFDQNLDLVGYYKRLGNNYAEAIQLSGVRRVVNLSSIGAHLEKDNGILLGAHSVEQRLNQLPAAVSLTHMRPVAFYYNLYGFTELIKSKGIITANYGEHKVPWVSPIDIAAAVAEELTTPFTGRNVRYVVSEELTGNEVANIIGAAIGMPGLKWITISGKQILDNLKAAGMQPAIAAGLVEMYNSLNNGVLLEDYRHNKPAAMGKIKMSDFATEFAATFDQK